MFRLCFESFWSCQCPPVDLQCWIVGIGRCGCERTKVTSSNDSRTAISYNIGLLELSVYLLYHSNVMMLWLKVWMLPEVPLWNRVSLIHPRFSIACCARRRDTRFELWSVFTCCSSAELIEKNLSWSSLFRKIQRFHEVTPCWVRYIVQTPKGMFLLQTVSIGKWY